MMNSVLAGVCKNTAGTFECGSCNKKGVKRSGPMGTIYSHSGWDGDSKRYDPNMDKQWFIIVMLKLSYISPPAHRLSIDCSGPCWF